MYANVICSSNVSILTSLTWLDYQVGFHTWKSVCLSKLWITVAMIATKEAIKLLPHMSGNIFMHKSHGLLGLRNIVLFAFPCAEGWGHDNLNLWNVVLLYIHMEPNILPHTANALTPDNAQSLDSAVLNTVFLVHFGGVIMGAIASQITSLTIVYSTVYSQIKENIKAPCHCPLSGEFTGDRWIPGTNSQ